MSTLENKRAKNIHEKLVLIPATEAVDTPLIEATGDTKPIAEEKENDINIFKALQTPRPERQPYVQSVKKDFKPKLSNKELQDNFNKLVSIYLHNLPEQRNKSENDELEVKFGTRGIKPITKIDYDNVIQKLKSFGFNPIVSSGEHILRMQNRIIDPNTGRFKNANARLEIIGISDIQKYCTSNLINDVKHVLNIYFKQDVMHDGEYLKSVDFDEFNFRLAYKKEKRIGTNGKAGYEIIDAWDNSKKEFRYINRVTLVNPNFPFKIDMSIVKSSDKNPNGYGLKMTDSIKASGVLTNPEHYEIEIEMDNDKIGFNQKFNKNQLKLILETLRKGIKYILCGLQGTNYPISYVEQTDILNRYFVLLHKIPLERRIQSRDFVGPSPQTLQIKNIVPLNKNSISQNIRTGYVVTEKTDGHRHLLYISHNGRIYLINSSMKIIFSGSTTDNKEIFNTLIDGELVLHNKFNNFINLFAAFDIYYLNNQDIRSYYFMPENDNDVVLKSRYYILNDVIDSMNSKSIVEGDLTSPLRIICKQFYPKKSSESIFQACNTILTNINEGLFEYNTDGLIFTPISFGVGEYEKGKASKPERITWEAAFKWKPPKFNTIDFLVTTAKKTDGQDIISTIFEDGINVISNNNQYKTLILECGISEKNDIYLNPCQNIIDDTLPEFIADSKSAYKHMQFYPTNPYDVNAGICNIMLKPNSTGALNMFTEEGEVFNNNTIVEFSYDLDNSDKPNIWKWTPLRVRYDKTNELRNGAKQYGNDYRTANNNWASIHNPITEDMLMYETNIPETIYDEEDIYYSESSKKTTTRGLRDFHNLFVKKSLISSVSKHGDTLIDLACGKGGDLPKWVAANLSFVFGIDIFKDNLENILNGACARYLNFKKQFKTMPYALFVHGNSSENIRSGKALFNEKGAEITRAVFGQGVKSAEKLGKGVVRQFAKGSDGFNITSCQFAIHYFCESPHTFYNFIRNVAECTKIGGYFIGTSYDGNILFNRLKNVATDDSIIINSPGASGLKVWEVIKEYDSTTLEDDTTCLGQRISVFQESIGRHIPEFLVNYDFLTRTLGDYGFKLISKNEAKQMGMPNGTGLFSELFNVMQHEIDKDPTKLTEYKDAINMTAYEKSISYLNRYFIYKKVSTVNAEKLTIALLHKDANEYVNETIETKQLVSEVKNIEKEEHEDKAKEVVKVKKPRVKKLNSKLLINDNAVATEDVITVTSATAATAPIIAPIIEISDIVIEENPKTVTKAKPVKTKAATVKASTVKTKPKLIIEE